MYGLTDVWAKTSTCVIYFSLCYSDTRKRKEGNNTAGEPACFVQ